jgi:hypothetical protein
VEPVTQGRELPVRSLLSLRISELGQLVLYRDWRWIVAEVQASRFPPTRWLLADPSQYFGNDAFGESLTVV